MHSIDWYSISCLSLILKLNLELVYVHVPVVHANEYTELPYQTKFKAIHNCECMCSKNFWVYVTSHHELSLTYRRGVLLITIDIL